MAEEFLEGLKRVIDSPLMDGAAKLAGVGKYLGLDPGFANAATAAATVRDAFEGKLTTQETVGNLTSAAANWLGIEYLENLGLPSWLASAIGDVASLYIRKLTTQYTAEGLGMIHNTKVGAALGVQQGRLSGGESVTGEPPLPERPREAAAAAGTRV